jgi:Rps23 Pro-64 3,4-dihydroxylase Tpa1-like proline 4-hydroxylase
MNKERRKAIAVAFAELEKLQAQWDDIKESLSIVRDEEREAFDNMPESLQQGERGQQSEAAADALDSAVEMMESADIAEILSYLDTAGE